MRGQICESDMLTAAQHDARIHRGPNVRGGMGVHGGEQIELRGRSREDAALAAGAMISFVTTETATRSLLHAPFSRCGCSDPPFSHLPRSRSNQDVSVMEHRRCTTSPTIHDCPAGTDLTTATSAKLCFMADSSARASGIAGHRVCAAVHQALTALRGSRCPLSLARSRRKRRPPPHRPHPLCCTRTCCT